MGHVIGSDLAPAVQTLRSYNINASHFADLYESAEHGATVERHLQLFGAGARVLSLGCGSGKIEAGLLHRGVDIIATDGSRAMLDEAARRHPALEGRLRQLTLPERFPFADEELDGVMAITVLMHLQPTDVEKVAEEISRVLKRGRPASISVTPTREDLNEARVDRKGRYYNGLTMGQLEALCATHGLVLQDSHIDGDALKQGVRVEVGVFERKFG